MDPEGNEILSEEPKSTRTGLGFRERIVQCWAFRVQDSLGFRVWDMYGLGLAFSKGPRLRIYLSRG